MKRQLLLLLTAVLVATTASAQSLDIICNGFNCTTPVSPDGTPYQYVGALTGFTGCEPNSLTKCKYEWTVTNGVITTNPSGTGTTGANVKWNNVNGNGTIKVKVSPPAEGCSSCPTLEVTKTLTIRYLGTPGTIKLNGVATTGSIQVPCGNTPITLAIDPVTNATGYSWSLPSGWSGAVNSSTITVTPSTNTQGTISVSASRSDVSGWSIPTNTPISITRPLPVLSSITPAVGNPLSLCSPSQTISASATGVNADKFVWTPSGGVRINGASTPQTVAGNVNISAASSDGSYTVAAYSTACAVASTNNQSKNVWYGPASMNSGTYETNGLTYGLVEEGGGTPNPNALCYTGPSSGGVVKVNYSKVLTQTWTKDYSVPANVPWSQNQYGGVNITFQAANQEILFELNFGNNCNSISKYYGFRSVNCSQGLTVFPNPSAQDVLTVQFDNVENEQAIPSQIALFSEKSTDPVRTIAAVDVFKKKGFKDKNKLEINVKDLPRGNYYLHVKHAKIVNKATEKIRVILD
jgi:hypothetical protein